VLIIPSLGVPNWSVIYIINTAPSSKFSGAVAGEREDFCKGSLARTIFYFVFSFALFYFSLHLFIKNTKKIVPFRARLDAGVPEGIPVLSPGE
jgi:hypothetical protein